MKARVRGIDVEGTPEEIAAFERAGTAETKPAVIPSPAIDPWPTPLPWAPYQPFTPWAPYVVTSDRVIIEPATTTVTT